MNSHTTQEEIWKSIFGKDYTDRNIFNKSELDNFYHNLYGVTRAEMNQRFIGDLDKSAKILEVGSNVGNQLICLQEMGFINLYGIELQEYAVELSKQSTKGINIIQGSAFDIPFKDNFFDLVFTSGVLIHIAPDNLKIVMSEIVRCSKKFIWGFEYYADELTEINYRGNTNILWKTNYAKLYLVNFHNLELIKKENYKQTGTDNIDQMFLLKKKI